MKKALFVYGGWEGHQPRQSSELFAAVLRGEGYEVELSDTLDVFLDVEKVRSLSLIVPVLVGHALRLIPPCARFADPRASHARLRRTFSSPLSCPQFGRSCDAAPEPRHA